MSDRGHLFFDIVDLGKTLLIEHAQVQGITRNGFWLQDNLKDLFIPSSAILDSDRSLDGVKLNDKISVEIPRWLAREKGLVE